MKRAFPTLAVALLGISAVGVVVVAEDARDDDGPSPDAVTSVAGSVGSPIELVLATRWSPVRGHLHTRAFVVCLEDELDRPVEVLQRESYAAANALIASGRGQVALVCSGATLDSRIRASMVPVLRLDDGSGGYYRSVVVARADDPSGTIEEMPGATIAWTDPDSLTGYRAPRAALRARGIEPDDFFSHSIFTRSHDASVDAVLQGLVRVGAVDEVVYRSRAAQNLKVVWTSAPFPSPPILVRGDLPELKQALAAVADRQECLADLGATRLVPADWSTYDVLAETIESGR